MKKIPTLAAVVLAAVPSIGSAATISGTLAGLEGVAPSAAEPIDLLATPYDFQAGFLDADEAGIFQFDFQNTGSRIANVQIDFTFLQNNDEVFSGGVTASFGSASLSVAEGANEGRVLTAAVGGGDLVSLIINYGDPTGNDGGRGPVGPDIDFAINTTPVPLPAGAVLLLSGLGILGWRKRKA